MLPILTCIRDLHDPWLVALAALVCVMSASGAVLLCRQVQWSQSHARAGWLLTAGVVTGLGIWATHFIAMLGYDPGVIFGFDALLTLGSLGLVVIATTIGLAVAAHRPDRLGGTIGALVTGGGIAAMHYIGMAALEMPAVIRWNMGYVAASVLLVVAPLAFALPLALGRRSWARGAGAALLITAAVVMLHFTGMTAISLIPSRADYVPEAIFTPRVMSTLIFAALCGILALSTIAAVAVSRTHRMIREKERQFSVLVSGITDYAIYRLDAEGRVTHWNTGAERLLGYSAAEALGRHIDSFRTLAEGEAVGVRGAAALLAAASDAERPGEEGWQQRRDGSRFWAHSTLETICDERGRPIGFARITRDMTRMKADQDKLEQARLHLDTALKHMHQGLCLFGADGRLILRNRRFLDMWRLAPAAIADGATVPDIARAIAAARGASGDERMMMEERLYAAFANAETTAMVSEFGEDLVVSIATRPLPDGGWVSTFEDITQQRRSEARIAHMAMHDGLTGLPNRAKFSDAVDDGIAFAQRTQTRLGLAVIDMDGFKDINDTHGHATGDEALRILAARLGGIAREGETVARLGGDEFAAILPFNEDHELADFLERLGGCFDAPWQPSENSYLLKASIGVAIYPDDGASREQLCNNADLAMYRAKVSNDETICYYEKGMDESARYRRQIAGELRTAIERGEFSMVYQPQRSLKTQALLGYEALLRWHHPMRGMVAPAEFIPIAEETGEIFRIGEWVLRQACREAANWADDLIIAVNISAVQLGQPNLPELIAQILLETGLPARRLEVEITETAIIGDKARALHILRRIKAMGVAIAIDDFGTGYSSLDTLNSFPFDKIKIDRSFLQLSGDRPQARAIIRAVLALGRSLEVPVLAEGVESSAHVDLLEAEGCEQVQGYLFGVPQHPPSAMPDAERRAG